LRIGLIGVGQMGGAIARRLAGAGHEVAAYDVRSAALAPLAASGVAAARSAREVAERCELIAVAVLDDAQVLEVLQGSDGILAGARGDAVVVIHSTVAPATLRRAGELAKQCGIALIEAAVSGADGHNSVGNLCVMVGGERAAFERARPALEVIGSLVLHLGPLGAGLDAKLVRNAIVYQQYLAGYEGFRLAAELGVPRDALRAILDHTGVVAPNLGAFLRERGDMAPLGPQQAERRRAFEITTATARKDLAAALARAREVGVELPATERAAAEMAAVFGVPDPGAQPHGTKLRRMSGTSGK
jgi:3-hydroxyisobutyrate dehydrogenase